MRLKAIGGAIVAAVAVTVVGGGVAHAALPSHVAGFRTYLAPTSAQTTFTVPTANCSSVPADSGFQAVALGTQLYQPPFAGVTDSSGIFLVVICPGPVASYEAIAQINGTQQLPALAISPGDVVTTSASENASGTALTISDANQNGGAPQTFNGPGGTPRYAAVGAIAGNCSGPFSACSPVPMITPVSFTGATLNGRSFLGALALPTNLTSQAGAVQISTRATGLKSFTDTWVSSCGVGPGIC